jgi:hypothetical protein
MFKSITATPQEIKERLPGDDMVPKADVVMDRVMTLPGTPEIVWPWFVQLGKTRSGWYFPSKIERFIPKKKRALRHINPQLQDLHVGKVIDDWGGKDAKFEVAILDQLHAIVFISKRGKTSLSWAIVLKAEGENTKVHFRLRLSPIKAKWLANSLGNLFDALTLAGLRAGLVERLR